jgi:hypothetical protein
MLNFDSLHLEGTAEFLLWHCADACQCVLAVRAPYLVVE